MKSNPLLIARAEAGGLWLSTIVSCRCLAAFRCLVMINLAALIVSGTLVSAQVNHGRLLTTFSNPSPGIGEFFGYTLAAVGDDGVLAGVPYEKSGKNIGTADLFRADGLLQTTFANPTPANDDLFAYSLAGVGNNQVLIGAPGDSTGALNTGAAYLFNTNGGLMTTFANPSPQDSDMFGISVAAVGRDRVLIGAPADNTGATQAGAAYLFSTNGALLMTFNNPTPAVREYFGYSVAALGNDFVVIGAAAADSTGAAYLFGTNGALITTFANPTPAVGDGFGSLVAAAAPDTVLIAAPSDDMVGLNAGAAYLFNTNGTLLRTFFSLAPVNNGFFGSAITAVGKNRVLIGAYHDSTGAEFAGAVCLFSMTGELLTTFENPTPADADLFGLSLAALGNSQVLISAQGDSEVSPNSGSVYRFALPYPQLNIARTGASVSLNWKTPETGIDLQQADRPDATNWASVLEAVVIAGTTNSVQQTLGTSNRFFRLHRQ